MRVALYIRVSTQEQSIHGLSVDAQTAALDEWAKNQTVVDHYVDLGVSARSPASKRPELQRMLRDCEAGKIDLIAFTKLDRFFRNVKEYYRVEDILDKCKVAWRAIHEDYETQTAAGRLKVNIMLAVAQDEADRTSERIKAVFERKREKGLVPTGAVPIGVKLVEGHYQAADDAQTVRDMFKWFIASRSAEQVARKCHMTANGVRYLLRNDTYLQAGVIDRETWDTVQEIISTRAQRTVRSDRVYLFSGLLRCPHCGTRLTCVRVGGHSYYRCPRHYDGKCPGVHVSELKVEAFLLEQLIPTIKEYNVKIKTKGRAVDVAALKKKQDKLTDLYMNDLINRDKYEADFKALQSQIEAAEVHRRPIDAYEVKSLMKSYDEWTPAARKAFWSTLVQSITPDGDSYVVDYT